MWMINLLPSKELRQRAADRLNYYTLIGGIATVTGAVVLAGVLLLFDKVYQLNLDSLKSQKAQAESQAVLYLDVEKKAKDLAGQLESLKKAQAQTTRWASLMTELQALTPPNVSIRAIDFRPATPGTTAGTGAGAGSAPATSTKTQIVGTADSRRSLGQFQLALSKSPYFRNVDIETSNLVGLAGIDYQITMDVNYDKLTGTGK